MFTGIYTFLTKGSMSIYYVNTVFVKCPIQLVN